MVRLQVDLRLQGRPNPTYSLSGLGEKQLSFFKVLPGDTP